MALYMTVILVGRYEDNKSATSISYNQFGDTDKDQYPTYSVCLEGDGLYKYNGSAIYEAYGINPSNYEKMLLGQPTYRYGYDHTRRLFNKTSLPLTRDTHLRFEDIVQNSFEISDIIAKANFHAENQNLSVRYEKNFFFNQTVVDEPPFYVSYQTANKRCLTREKNKINSLIRNKDEVYWDMSILHVVADLELFIHHPGQLIRSFDSPTFKANTSEMQKEYRQIKVSQSTVWKKRSIKGQRCLNDVDYYDQYIQQAISKNISCLPPFWKNTINLTTIPEECTSLEKLKRFNDLIHTYKSIFHEIQTPCVNMFNSVQWRNMPQKRRSQDGLMEIIYSDKYYEEILQVEDFGMHDFISNLGGFIGIFLGYSIMQIPELLGKF